MSLLGENFDPTLMGRIREDEYESRSGSDHLDGGGSGDDQDADDKPPRKKKYHRHTPQQIQELEAFFKECPHPDEKQRLELSRRLNLETKQVKFWFQNRRTQMKTQLERHENIILKQENEKLRIENMAIKDAMHHPICNNCGGPAVLGEISYEEHHLRIENARLKDELSRICSMADKFLGKPVSPMLGAISPATPNCGLDLAVGRNGFGLNPIGTTLPMALDLGDGVSGIPHMVSPSGPTPAMMSAERSMLLDLAVAAMNELLKMAQPDTALWIKSLDGGKDTLNHEEYRRTFFPCIGLKPRGFVTEATRETGEVKIKSSALVEALMDADQWADMFPSLIARSSTIEVISSGMGGTRNNALQLMQAELQVLSPLVPARQLKFLRFCKQQTQGSWAVVDVSIDSIRESSNAPILVSCRRLPSGCVVEDMPNGNSKITWVEHSDYDESVIHTLYQPLLSSGIGFGAQRWVSTLQKQCEYLAMFISPMVPGELRTVLSSDGKRNLIKLAQRMTVNFCASICASSLYKWEVVCVGNVGDDVKMMTRKAMGPGEPQGVVFFATMSVWIPIPQPRLYEILRDPQTRRKWDILSLGEDTTYERLSIPKGGEHGNCISLLTTRNAPAIQEWNQSCTVILQDTSADASGSLVVYAALDSAVILQIMQGRDPLSVPLISSGYAILPDGSAGMGGGGSRNVGGSLLTVGLQILLDQFPASKLSVESIQSVNAILLKTIESIRAIGIAVGDG